MEQNTQRWFMPWRWSRWTWVLLPPFALLIYFLSAVPALRLAYQRTMLGPESLQFVSLAYRPIWIFDAHCDVAAATIDWEDSVMDRILGLEGDWGITNPGGPFWMRWSQIDIERFMNDSPRRASKPTPEHPPAGLTYWPE